MITKEKSLQTALLATQMQKNGLPKMYNPKSGDIWVKAIVLVLKSTLEECYCIYRRHGDGYMSLVQDCGSGTGIIKSVLRIHPYIYLDKERFFPKMSYPQKRSFLKTELSYDYTLVGKVDSMTDEEVDIALIDEGARRQLICYEIDRVNNLQSEGNDQDETRKEDILDREFRAEVAQMKAAGVSQQEIDAYIKQYEASKQPVEEQTISDDDYLDEAEELRREMEYRDIKKTEEDEYVSVDGEFDAKEVDVDALKAETERYRHEQRLISKRKFKRRIDGQDKFAVGNACVNELGEIEDVKTIELPEDANERQKEIMNKGVRKPGRPKGSKTKVKTK